MEALSAGLITGLDHTVYFLLVSAGALFFMRYNCIHGKNGKATHILKENGSKDYMPGITNNSCVR